MNMVACAACNRVVAASKNGHPRRHSPHNRLQRGARRAANAGTCDGTYLAGFAVAPDDATPEKPYLEQDLGWHEKKLHAALTPAFVNNGTPFKRYEPRRTERCGVCRLGFGPQDDHAYKPSKNVGGCLSSMRICGPCGDKIARSTK